MNGLALSLLCSGMLMSPTPSIDDRYGFLDPPAYRTARVSHGPMTRYEPQAGDIVLFSNTNLLWSGLYAVACTGSPGHSGIVARLPDGRFGVLEAGYKDTLQIRFVPLEERFRDYPGKVWVRQRKTPLTEEQSARVTEFARVVENRPYSAFRLVLQLTPFRARGPLRTAFLGKPRGIRSSYICSEAVLECLVYAGVLDAETTRPSATYPQDMFYDESWNPYINKHLRLYETWEIPARWHASRVESSCPCR